jgi:nitroreductase
MPTNSSFHMCIESDGVVANFSARQQVLALGTRDDTALARLRAGEATSLVLTATALGLASCPVPEPLEVPETRIAVQSDVFGNSGFPQMLLRVGWAPVNADPLPRTPRRPVEDVVEWIDFTSPKSDP